MTASKLQSEELWGKKHSFVKVTLSKLISVRDESLCLQVKAQHKLNQEHFFFFSWVVFYWAFGGHFDYFFVVVAIVSRGWIGEKYHKWKHSSL